METYLWLHALNVCSALKKCMKFRWCPGNFPTFSKRCLKKYPAIFPYCIMLLFYPFGYACSLFSPRPLLLRQASFLRCVCLYCTNACVNSSIRPHNLTDNWNKVGNRCWGHPHTHTHTQRFKESHFHGSTQWCIRINSGLKPWNQ